MIMGWTFEESFIICKSTSTVKKKIYNCIKPKHLSDQKRMDFSTSRTNPWDETPIGVSSNGIAGQMDNEVSFIITHV